MLNLAAGLPLSPAELALAQTATDEDLALLNACLVVEQELREQGYAAVERLLANVAGREGKLDERVVSLPDPAAARALCDLYEAGWVYDAS
jgi:hypothetical protein